MRERPRLRTTTQLLVVGLVACAGIGIIRTPHGKLPIAKAQSSSPDPYAGLDIQPTGYLLLEDPTIGQSPDFVVPVSTTDTVPFSPPDPNYYADKADSDQANQNIGPRPETAVTANPNVNRPSAARSSVSAGATSGPSVEYAFNGLDRNASAGDNDPPDTHGVIGANYYVQVVNSQVAVYPRVNGGLGQAVKNCPLSNLFANPNPYNYPSGFTGRTGFYDPRAIYDRATDRYIVTAAAFPESSSVQYLFVAISAPGTQPFVSTAQYAVHRINVNTGYRTLFDYPSVGIDQNALIFTGNVYTGYNLSNGSNGGGGLATVFSIPKARLYSMAPPYVFPTVPYYSGRTSTLQPPIKLDSTPYTYLMAAPYAGFHYPGGTTLTLYRLSNTDQNVPALAGPYSVQVPNYYAPRNAKQPAGTDPYSHKSSSMGLDTLDGRFQSQSTQIGTSLFNVHCINSASTEQHIATYPTICWYEVGTAVENIPNGQANLRQRQMFWVSSTSDDFHPSLAADDSKNVYLPWNATNQLNGQNVSIWASGRRATDALNTLRPFTLEFTSSVPYLQEDASLPGSKIARWGDYSSVTIDPAISGRAWSVNEMVPVNNITAQFTPPWQTTYDWGSQVFRFSLGQ